MKRLIPLLLLAGCALNSTTVETTLIPVTPVPATSTTTIPPTTTTTVAPTTTTTTLVPADTKCAELAPIAHAAGWPQELLTEVLAEAWSESRCLNIIGSINGQPAHKNFNGTDWGPMQLNMTVWDDEMTNKYGDWHLVADPYYNFAWAWEMYIWFDAHKGCGFIPWTRPCK